MRCFGEARVQDLRTQRRSFRCSPARRKKTRVYGWWEGNGKKSFKYAKSEYSIRDRAERFWLGGDSAGGEDL